MLVRDGVFSETRLYVDGQLADTRSVTQGAFANDAPMTVGRGTISGAVRTYSGQMDGLGLYSRPLRHDEVLRSYRGKQSGLYRTMWGCELPVRVMPLGDSITAGTNGSRTKYFGTYRTSLYDTLTSTGYNVDFVSSAYSRHTDDQDRDHEGWPGYSSYQLRNIVRDSLAMNTADIVLVHAGTNKLSSALAGMTELLKSVDLYSKNVPVIVARIINQQTYNPDVTQYNVDRRHGQQSDCQWR
ncbi:MAG: hypothetical protein IPM37_08400 [Hahellaceae bacterium]|nr:hypothetical protein [Hahellaceae bacterium]